MTSSVAALRNPYDFANPVSEPKLFAGRRSELDDITYYINMAAKTDRPINLALLGDRASGKTSLLNMTEQMALGLGMVPVRIDLDESDVAHSFALFMKIFTALLTSACQRNDAFGGLHGRTFQTYLEMVSTFDVPNDRSFCSFLLPIQYARANAAGRLRETVVFDDLVRHDLYTVQQEVNTTSVLLFDECNVLSGSRPLLEKLRNIFMNTKGFMLVFAGTPNLFPVLDQVFSPISRQFKRIEVAGFQKIEETLDCIRKPLQSLEIDNPDDLFAFELDGPVRDIHRLTGGRPYEIQLVCHAMFRRLQEGRSERMSLDSGVLEDVRRDLVRAQSADRKVLIGRIQELSDADLLTLGILCGSGPSLGVEEAEQLEYVFHGTARLTREKFRASVKTLTESELIKEDEKGHSTFLGDDFDFTYFRYLSNEKELRLFLRRGMPIGISINFEFGLFIMRRRGIYTLFRAGSDGYTTAERISTLIELLSDPDDRSDLFREHESEMDDIYDILFLRPDVSETTLWEVQFAASWWDGCLSCYTFKDDEFEKNADEVRAKLDEFRRRGAEVKIEITVQELTICLPHREVALWKLAKSENARFRRQAAKKQMLWLRSTYLMNRKRVAEQHADIVSVLNAELEATELNNIGYLRLGQGRHEEASKLFSAGIAKADANESSFGLLLYNRGVARALEGNRIGALEDFAAAAKWAEGRPGSSTIASCLFALRGVGGEIAIQEVTGRPDLREMAPEGLRWLAEQNGAATLGEASQN